MIAHLNRAPACVEEHVVLVGGTRHIREICKCYGPTGLASVRIFYNHDRTHCVGTCQVQESVYSPCTRVPPTGSVECRVILFHLFHEKPIIRIRQYSRKTEKGALRDGRDEYKPLLEGLRTTAIYSMERKSSCWQDNENWFTFHIWKGRV